MQQKPPDLDDNLRPVVQTFSDVKPPDLDDSGNPETSDNLIERAWKAINTPIEPIRKFATDIGDEFSRGAVEPGIGSWLKNFAGGSMQAIGEMATPLNLAGAVLDAGEYAGMKAGLPAIAKLASRANTGIGVAQGMHGLGSVTNPDSTMSQRFEGAGEIAMGAIPFLQRARLRQIGHSVGGGIPNDVPIYPGESGYEAPPTEFYEGEVMPERPPDMPNRPGLPPSRQPLLPAHIEDIGQSMLPGHEPEIPYNELPSPSLTDRPPEVRSIEELESRIKLLESKPFLNEGGKAALEKMRAEYEQRKLLEESNFQEAGVEGKRKAKIRTDTEALSEMIATSLYKGDITTVATKELLQNSLDATRHLGPQGKIDIRFDDNEGILSVEDNGMGMTPDQIDDYYNTIGGSGKRDDPNAIGGFGVASGAPLLGGEHVIVQSVARDPKSGKLIGTSFSGTRRELIKGEPDMHITEPPEGTPTGTIVKVKVPKGEYGYSFYEAKALVNKISKYSNIPGKITGNMIDTYGETDFMDPRTMKKPTELTRINDPAGEVGILRPSDAELGERSAIRLHLLNKGMYQSSYTKYLEGKTSGIPSDLLVNIDAKVPEGHPNYPFTMNRESLRGSLEKAVSEYIDANVITPAIQKQINGIQDLYDGMPSVTAKDGTTLHFHDTENKFTPEEYSHVMNHPIIQNLGKQISDHIWGTLEILRNHPQYMLDDWLQRLDRVGIIFDEGLKGIHIPDPKGGNSAILINPLQLMTDRIPDESARGFIHTILHEMAHIDPKVHFKDRASHGDNWGIRMSQIDEIFGARRTINAQQQFLNTVAPDGSYTPEVQKLLQRYSESRRRTGTKKDILRATGVESKADAKSTSGNGKDPIITREGTSTIIKNPNPIVVKQVIEQGYTFKGLRDDGSFEFVAGGGGGGKPPILEFEVGMHQPTPGNTGGNKPKEPGFFHQLYNFPRTVMASMDFSAPLRQGLPLIHKKAFWTSLSDMFNAWGSEAAYDQIHKDILARPLFKPRIKANGTTVKSFAEEAGLKFTDLIANREEAIVSKLAEKIPGVRRSNRAYTAFLNKLRADTFEDLISKTKVFGADAKANLPLARELANFVNTASGRGDLGKLEKSAVVLNNVLFSPRLIASRLTMLNPKYYIMANPAVRKEALKSLFAIAAVGNTITQLGKLAGGTVETDPSNSDFGKLKIGNVRLDPYGGFQQYITAAQKLIRPSFAKAGEPTNTGVVPIDMMTGAMAAGGNRQVSSTTGKEFDLWNPRGPYDPTMAKTGLDFIRGKSHPVIGFAWSLLSGMKEMTGQDMQFGPVNPMENAIGQRFMPILFQDLYSLAQEDDGNTIPKSIMGFLSAFGMSTQVYGGNQQ